MSVNITLVDPKGNEWLAGSPSEVNDLLAAGYRVKGSGPVGDGSGLAGSAPGPADPEPLTLADTSASDDQGPSR